MKETITKVIFRRWPKKEGNDVIALFPYLEEGRGCCLSYQRVGQHASASYFGCMRVTKPTRKNDKDVRNLFREITQRGYNLKVIKRKGKS